MNGLNSLTFSNGPTIMTFNELKDYLIHRYAIEPDLDDVMYLLIAEDYGIQLNDDGLYEYVV